MKIGILTFHWATNYGAVLQSYALQEYLSAHGHEVCIINYKPKNYDISLLNILKHPILILRFRRFYVNCLKEKKLKVFRDIFLHQTKRLFSQDEVSKIANDYDVLISGSDQILNPYFTTMGEGKNTYAYYLYFPKSKCKKIGFSVSFGCVDYPSDAKNVASTYIQSFDKIGVREDSGLHILSQLKYEGMSFVTPDPTVLMGDMLFKNITIKDYSHLKDYICVYMIRRSLNIVFPNSVIIDDVHKVYSMEEWLGLIRYSKMLITNSYHGMIMAILFHIPFVIDIENGNGLGMNDRFYTLLNRLGLVDRIADNNLKELILNGQIDWDDVDKRLSVFRNEGEIFLRFE